MCWIPGDVAVLRARSVTTVVVVYLALKIIAREVRVIQAFYTTKPALIHTVLHY